MQVINLFHPQIAVVHGQNPHRGTAFIHVSKKELLFSVAACKEFKEIKINNYVSFIEHEDQWTFYVNDDDSGFLLTKKFGNTVRIVNRMLCKMLLKDTLSANFSLEYTGDVYYDKRIIKIIRL